MQPQSDFLLYVLCYSHFLSFFIKNNNNGTKRFLKVDREFFFIHPVFIQVIVKIHIFFYSQKMNNSNPKSYIRSIVVIQNFYIVRSVNCFQHFLLFKKKIQQQ